LSTPIPVALIGTGFAASVYAEAIRHVGGLRLVKIAGRDRAKGLVLARSTGVNQFEDDISGVLMSDDIAAVVLAVPPFVQPMLAIEAFRNGKHVLCEKPLATDCSGAEQIFAAWRTSRRVGMVNFCYRMIPEMVELKRLVKSGECGDLQSLHVEWVLSSRLNRSLTQHWKNQKAQGGGALQSYGTHVIDYLFHDAPGVTVCGASRSVYIKTRPDTGGSERLSTGDEVSTVLFKTDDGVSAVMHLSLVTVPAIGHRIVARGSSATLELCNADPRSPAGPFFLYRTDAGNNADRRLLMQGIESQATMSALFTRVLGRFADNIQKGTQTGPSIADGLKVARLVSDIDRIAV